MGRHLLACEFEVVLLLMLQKHWIRVFIPFFVDSLSLR